MRWGDGGDCRLSFGLSDLGFCALYVTKEGTCTDSVALNPGIEEKGRRRVTDGGKAFGSGRHQ